MRYSNILEKVYGEPWNITPAGWYSIHQLVYSKLLKNPNGLAEFGTKHPEARRPKSDFYGDPIDQMRIQNGVAIVPIKGSLVKGAGMIDKCCGATSHEDIQEDLDNIIGAGVKKAVLDIGSPGGMVMGTKEVADKVAQMTASGIRIIAYTEGLMCSAAYEIAAGASEIYATGSATVGSIGTIWEFQNVSAALEAAGIEYNIFTSGKYKGTGHPAKELTPDQKEWIQAHVDMLANEFKSHVTSHRPAVKKETMQGQIFTGNQASENGLIDATVSGLNEVLALF